MAVKTGEGLKFIGKGIPRFDGAEKVKGQAQYADDVPVPGCWYGFVVRSPVSKGRLKGLRFNDAFDWEQVCVVTPKDIPGKNIVDLMGQDMPFIAHDQIEYLGEPLALIAAPSLALAKVAAKYITPDIEEETPRTTMQEVVSAYKDDRTALKQLWSKTIRKGNVEDGFAEADHVIEGEYWCGHQEQLYIEPQGMVAELQEDGGVYIYGSMQCPYYINPELCITLNVPPEKLRVKQTVVGGAFGGKEEFPTLLAGYCALLAMKCNKPVKIIYDRHQDILYSTKRHPAWSRYKAGVKNDGTITAVEIEFLLDGGAYITISPVVLFRGILHAAMGYRCENVKIDGLVYQTNTFPNGAFRGFGAPQSLWAWESHIDELAEACGLAPHTFRLQNCLHEGDVTPTGQVLEGSVGSPEVLTKSLEMADFEEKFKRCSHGRDGERTWYGIGVSFFAHGSGFTGDGEARIKARGALDMECFEDGRPGVNIRISSTEMGQGTLTIMPQIVAEALRLPIDRVRMPLPDTSLVPDSGPTVASRTAMVVGSVVFGAAKKMRAELEDWAEQNVFKGQKVELIDGVFKGIYGEEKSFEEVANARLKQGGPMRVYNQFKLPSKIKWNQDTFEGDAYPSYSWGCNVAEVEVDTLTMEFKVKKITAVYDIGRLLNPVLAMGQIEGGLVQALGYSIMENMNVRDGIYDANRMQTYVIPTTLDVPEMDLDFVEYPYEDAAPGAKGVGEIPMDGLAPAIANALKQATGVRLNTIPIMPEGLYEKIVRKSSAA